MKRSFKLALLTSIILGVSACDSTDTETDSTNTAPVADAGSDQDVSTGDTVELSASDSSDADGDSLTYTWTLSSVPSGSSATLSDDDSEDVSFTADVEGTYEVELVVNDGTTDSATDTVTIEASDEADEDDEDDSSDYSGTGAITQGIAQTVAGDLFPDGIRVAAIGEIDDDDGTTWTVPAEVLYEDDTMPFASDLHNIYVDGHDYESAEEAIDALDGSDIIDVDSDGEVVTAYIFADNYFEMYVNGVEVGKDPVPFTDFNSNIVRFRVNQPFDVAFLLVDWEENLGTGTEDNQGYSAYPGDGGLVAVFKDADEEVLSITDSSWKAQTYYTAPISDLTCLSEEDNERLSTSCSTEGTDDASVLYGVHWSIPDSWMEEGYDDSDWPDATTFDNDTVGVDNKPSYTNFVDIFDDSENDAQFIWSSNLVLDNEILFRKTIGE